MKVSGVCLKQNKKNRFDAMYGNLSPYYGRWLKLKIILRFQKLLKGF